MRKKHRRRKPGGEVPIWASPLRRGSSYCGSACGSNKNRKNQPAKKVLTTKQNPPKSTDFRGFLELLTRFELVTSSLPTAMAIFFAYFPLIYSRFCSISFAFRHSLKTAFPYIPRLSVAGYVVRNPCGTWVSSPEAILFQAKKVVKFESGCLKPTVNSGEVSSDELHLRLQ